MRGAADRNQASAHGADDDLPGARALFNQGAPCC
jgi:hypothetical protein